MSTYQIYFSPTGHTMNIVNMIGEEFEEAKQIDLSNQSCKDDYVFHKEDVCIIGVPSYGGRVPAIALERMINYQGNGATAILVVSYGNRAYDDTLIELQDFLVQKGFRILAGIAAVAQHSIMHQFAMGRPDALDQKELHMFAKQIVTKLQSNHEYPDLKVKGNIPYREYRGIPLKPKADKYCTACGLCAKACPVSAIPLQHPQTTNTDLCISCMRCVTICPSHARKVSSLKIKVASMKLKKACIGRKDNELFI